MLFPYKYLENDISNLQKWIDFLFINVWCSPKGEFSFELLSKCPKLKEIAEKEAYKEEPTNNKVDYLTGPIAVIYDIFKDELTSNDRKRLKKWYKRSRKIEKVCNNEKLFNPISITDIKKISDNLAKELYTFYTNLYNHVLDLSSIKKINGSLKNHYDEFVKLNKNGVCPFCGIAPFRSYEMTGHEAYDHYFPKETYPLYSVYFKNLVPTCHECNSIHKTRNNPIRDKKTNHKRKVFYPYSLKSIDIQLDINLSIIDYKIFEHSHINLKIYSKKDKEKTNIWKKIYNIESRYKDILTNEGIGKYWLVEFYEEIEDVGHLNFEIKRLEKKLEKSKYKDKTFLKVPFVLAYKDLGVFN